MKHNYNDAKFTLKYIQLPGTPIAVVKHVFFACPLVVKGCYHILKCSSLNMCGLTKSSDCHAE